MNDQEIVRVHYYPRQILRTQDFSDEQAYHVHMRRRHNIAHHQWGIVHGLELELDTDNQFWLNPGFAIDGYGRELIIPARVPLSQETFSHKQTNKLDVLLVYNRQTGNDGPTAYDECDVDMENGNPPSFYRWREMPTIRISAFDPTETNWREPKIVPETHHDFPPHHTPPDESMQQWPVFLGRMVSDPDDKEEPLKVDLTGRPYAGLVGASVITPDRQTRLRLGAMPLTANNRFVVEAKKPKNESTKEEEELWDPLLEINNEGKTTIHGPAHVNEYVLMQKGAIHFAEPNNSNHVHSWSIYRTKEPSPDSESAQVIDQKRDTSNENSIKYFNQMRLVIGQNNTDPQAFVIGTWKEEQFIPCLTVTNQSEVRVHGNLIVEGHVEEKEPRVQLGMDEVSRNFALSSALSGMAGANSLLDGLYQKRVLNVEQLLPVLLEDQVGMQRIFSGLASESQKATFARQLTVESNRSLQKVVTQELLQNSGATFANVLASGPNLLRLITALRQIEGVNELLVEILENNVIEFANLLKEKPFENVLKGLKDEICPPTDDNNDGNGGGVIA